MKKLLLLLLLSGCVTETDTRMCADYGSYTIVRERCVLCTERWFVQTKK